MSLEVANVKATTEFVTKGEQQAVAAFKSVEQAADTLGNTLSVTSSKMEVLQHRADQQASALQAAQAAVEAQAAVLKDTAPAVAALKAEMDALAESFRNSGNINSATLANYGNMTQAIAAEIAELSNLELQTDKMADAEQKLAAEQMKAISIAQQITAIRDAEAKAVERAAAAVEAAAQREAAAAEKKAQAAAKAAAAMEKQQQQAAALAKHQNSLSTKAQNLARNFSSIRGAARGGVQGLSQLATSLGRLGPYAVAAAVAVGLVIGVMKGLKRVAANSHLPELSAEMTTLAGAAHMTDESLKPLIAATENMFRAFDSSNVTQASEQVALMSHELSGLTGSLQASHAILMAMAEGSESAVQSVGFSVQSFRDLKESMEFLPEAAKRITILNWAQGQMAANSDRISAGTNKQITSFASLTAAVNQLFDKYAKALGPALNQVITLFEDLLEAIEPLLPIMGLLAKIGTGITVMILKLVTAGVKLILNVLKPLIDIGKHLPFVGDAFTEMSKAIEAMNNPGVLGGIEAIEDATVSAGEAADIARRKFRAYLDAVNGGVSIVEQFKAYGDALKELDKDDSIANQIEALSRYSQLLATIQNNPAGVAASSDMAKQLGLDGLDELLQGLARNGIAEVNAQLEGVGVAADTSRAPVDIFKGSIDAVTESSIIGAGAVNTLEGAMVSASGDYYSTMHVNIVQAGTGSSWGPSGHGSWGVANAIKNQFAGAGNKNPNPTKISTPTAPKVVGISTPSNVKPRTGKGYDGGLSDSERAGVNDPFAQGTQKYIDDIARRISDKAGSPRGGGGGGGGVDRDLQIDEIRKFIETVNMAVQAGIRGGVVYSTAGNAIPIGGPGEFVKNEGGTNIGTINLRGVWDFADPTAKREIVRQLQEALAQYQKEVS